ncbi:MAG TPA: class I SAM-dependent RNA methyltransferase [Mycobacteriales bacterium]
MTTPVRAPTLVLVVERYAHGGVCVAHAPDGRVVFVRHALPGERVRALVTAQRKAWLRADAIEVLEPSPERVEPPCPYAGPGKCGGCDLQHATATAQRAWKAVVVEEQLSRLAGVDLTVEVEPLPGGSLGWRTRVQFTVGHDGRAGLLAHHSHTVIPIDRCLIADERVNAVDVPGGRWPGMGSVEVAVAGEQVRTVSRPARGRPRVDGPAALTERVAGREFAVHGFWQVHPHAASALSDCVLEMLAPVAGEHALDLYAGAGLFAARLEDSGCEVVAVEGSRTAAEDCRANVPTADVRHQDVAAALDDGVGNIDVVVLDPPREGAKSAVVEAICALGPRAVAYVACEPAALARDVASFAENGYRLTRLRAFDLFPLTHHVECVALLTRCLPTS